MNPISIILNSIYSQYSYRNIKEIIKTEKPDIVHFHNTFLLISPSAYYACKEEKVPVVQSLHNYRLICPGALFYRNGNICERCIKKKIPYYGFIYGCWRKSRVQSIVPVAINSIHNLLKTWENQVDVYIALTEFQRKKFIEAGYPAEKIVVKPNFAYPDPGIGEGKGEYALFVGRLTPEKGIITLLKAWNFLKMKIPLKIIGDGPLRKEVEKVARSNEGIEYIGFLKLNDIYNYMKDAKFLVFPSEWYEAFPRVIVEALSCGLPIVTTSIGAQGSLIDDGRTGLHFQPGDYKSLIEKVEWLLSNPKTLAEMRKEARKEYETNILKK